MTQKCFLTNPNPEKEESKMHTFMLLEPVNAKYFGITENDFQDSLKEYGAWLIGDYICAHNKYVLDTIAMNAEISARVVEFLEVYPPKVQE